MAALLPLCRVSHLRAFGAISGAASGSYGKQIEGWLLLLHSQRGKIPALIRDPTPAGGLSKQGTSPALIRRVRAF